MTVKTEYVIFMFVSGIHYKCLPKRTYIVLLLDWWNLPHPASPTAETQWNIFSLVLESMLPTMESLCYYRIREGHNSKVFERRSNKDVLNFTELLEVSSKIIFKNSTLLIGDKQLLCTLK